MNDVNILLIEDDNIAARTIERSLRGNEFRVSIANSGIEGLKLARRKPVELVILDVIMPGMDGFAVCREMRADPIMQDLPILFLTGQDKDEDKVAGFIAGADDYLCKPFNIDELILRIRAILRRVRFHQDVAGAAQSSGDGPLITPTSGQIGVEEEMATSKYELVVGEYCLNIRTYKLQTSHRGEIRLTPVQFDLLYHLMSHPDEIFSPARLLDEVWDYPSDTGSPDLVRVHIKNLRERVEEDPRSPQFIQTVPGYGYTIQQNDLDVV
jgi:two-component system, OmpR family, response regulator RpaA